MNTAHSPNTQGQRPRWLWRLVGRFAVAVLLVASHHLWFDIPKREGLLPWLDGAVIFALAHALMWLIHGDSPNAEMTDANRTEKNQ